MSLALRIPIRTKEKNLHAVEKLVLKVPIELNQLDLRALRVMNRSFLFFHSHRAALVNVSLTVNPTEWNSPRFCNVVEFCAVTKWNKKKNS